MSIALRADTTAKPRFPITNADRPFTLPPEIAEIDLLATHASLADFNASINVSYGLLEDFQINASYDGVSLLDFETLRAEKAFHLGFDYFFLETPYFASMVDVDLPLYVASNVVQNIKLALPTSVPLWRSARVGLMLFNAGLVDFNFAPYFAADINLPARISWQATDALWLGLATNFATFHINQPDGSGGTLPNDYIWTKTPIYIAGLYGVSEYFDVVGRIGLHDVQGNWGDNFYVWLGVGVRFGRMY